MVDFVFGHEQNDTYFGMEVVISFTEETSQANAFGSPLWFMHVCQWSNYPGSSSFSSAGEMDNFSQVEHNSGSFKWGIFH